MKILGIESSCDETAAAVVEEGTKVLSDAIATSADLHAKTGGVIPEQAARQQVRSIIPVLDKSLSESSQSSETIDAVAVTVGPGLIGSLLVGVETAKAISYLWKKPIIPVNHLVAHIYANFLREFPNSKDQKSKKSPEFPALSLVVSGGHTDLVLMKGHGNLKWLGGTRDDAAGEAFDKCARLLGLGYPGGPEISKEAEKILGNKKQRLNLFPRPMIDEDNFEWSFSGLKTAVLKETMKLKNKKLSQEKISLLAAEIQEAIVDSLVTKTLRAIKRFSPKSFLLAGGVAANSRLRQKFQQTFNNELHEKVSFHVPPVKFCTDNAAVIAACAFYNYKPIDWKKISANPQLTIAGEI